MSKNIVVFSDGTGQEGGTGRNSNVYKLFNIIEDRTDRQVAFYDRGLGTGWRKIGGLVGGGGISRNIKEAYEFIFENFEAGDEIFLFGFSRGAATMRSLSNFIHHFGVLPQSRPELIQHAYDIYRTRNRKKMEARAQAFIANHHTMWTRIKVLACYDTVAALGLPFKAASAVLDGIPGFRHKFHDFRLSKSVEHAYHALAVDDERKTFHPILWDTDIEDYQTLKQVWFAGMHTDVGGGYPEQELSDIALVWMTQNAHYHGLHIYARHRVEIVEDAFGTMHDSRGRFVTKVYRRKQRSWDATRADKPLIHQSVIERARNEELPGGRYAPWLLGIDHEVEPWRRYQDQKWWSEDAKYPGEPRRQPI